MKKEESKIKTDFNDILSSEKTNFMIRDQKMIFGVISTECLKKDNLEKLNKKEFDFRHCKDKDMLIKLTEFSTELKLKHNYYFNVELILKIIKNLSKIDLFNLKFNVYYFNDYKPLFFVSDSYAYSNDNTNVIVLAPIIENG
jgi:hypothetical protein